MSDASEADMYDVMDLDLKYFDLPFALEQPPTMQPWCLPERSDPGTNSTESMPQPHLPAQVAQLDAHSEAHATEKHSNGCKRVVHCKNLGCTGRVASGRAAKRARSALCARCAKADTVYIRKDTPQRFCTHCKTLHYINAFQGDRRNCEKSLQRARDIRSKSSKFKHVHQWAPAFNEPPEAVALPLSTTNGSEEKDKEDDNSDSLRDTIKTRTLTDEYTEQQKQKRKAHDATTAYTASEESFKGNEVDTAAYRVPTPSVKASIAKDAEECDRNSQYTSCCFPLQHRDEESTFAPHLQTVLMKMRRALPEDVPENIMTQLEQWSSEHPRSAVGYLRSGCVAIEIDLVMPSDKGCERMERLPPPAELLQNFHDIRVAPRHIHKQNRHVQFVHRPRVAASTASEIARGLKVEAQPPLNKLERIRVEARCEGRADECPVNSHTGRVIREPSLARKEKTKHTKEGLSRSGEGLVVQAVRVCEDGSEAFSMPLAAIVTSFKQLLGQF